MRTSFVERDIESLRDSFAVDVFIGSGIAALARVVRGVFAGDLALSWFASVYAVAMVATARMLRRPSVIVLGGVDTARDEGIGYGIWRSRWRRPLLRWALRHATRVLAVDASLIRALEHSSGLRDLPIEVLPTGYDAAYWTPGRTRERIVLCVATCHTRERALVKGVDIFFEVARGMPHEAFELIGTDPEVLAHFSPPANVVCTPHLTAAELRGRYRAASVYCQPSRHEGLPNALCEAMLCGCVPVASSVGGIPDVVASCGYVVERDDVAGMQSAIASALDADETLRMRARERIALGFAHDVRRERLLSIIDELLHA